MPRLSAIFMLLWVLMVIASYVLFHRQTLIKSCLMGIGQMTISICVEYFMQLVISIAGNNFRDFVYTHQILAQRLPTLILLFIMKMMVQKVNIRLNNLLPLRESEKSKHLWLLYLAYLVLFTAPNLLHFENNVLRGLSEMDIYNLVVFLSFFIYSIVYIRNFSKVSDLSQQLEIQQLYTGTLEQSIQDLRSLKHDSANIFNTIGGFVELENLPSLKKYMKEIDQEFLQINTTDIVNAALRETPLYGIILSKLQLAEVRGIAFSVEVFDTPDFSKYDQLDISRIVGNLLDNALEEALESEGRLVHMEINSQYGINHISIRNSCRNCVNKEEIFSLGYTTKEGHSGLGLAKVSGIINKYQKRGFALVLSTDYCNGIFTQTLEG